MLSLRRHSSAKVESWCPGFMSFTRLQGDPRLVFMADTEEVHRKETMLNDNNEDTRWREKMVGGDNGLWTIECLRGRLLAERAASKSAKQDAELLGNKLIELEKRLKLEIKLKNKAEQKLKYLMGKLQSLKLSPIPAYSSLVNNEEYSTSSTASSGLTEQREQKSENQKTDSDTDDTATAGSRASSLSSSAGANQSYGNNSDGPSKEVMKCGLILRQTPTSRTLPKACQEATTRESSKTINSHSVSFSAGA